MAKPPLIFTFYIAAPIDKVWNGFVSKETNTTIFIGADFEVDSYSATSDRLRKPGTGASQ